MGVLCLIDLHEIFEQKWCMESKMIFIIIAQAGEHYVDLTLDDLTQMSSIEPKDIKKALQNPEFIIVDKWRSGVLKSKGNAGLLYSNDAKNIILYLNSKARKNFRITKSNMKFINARLKEGVSYEDMCKIIDLKVEQWSGTSMDDYLRPETLFNATKFETYYQQIQGNIPITNDEENNNVNYSESELAIYCSE